VVQRLSAGLLAVSVTLCSSAAAWGIQLGLADNLQNPALAALPPVYTDGLPAWYDFTPDVTISPAIQPPTLGTPFVGTVQSEVYYLNGVDASGGLGFAYIFSLDPTYTADGLESASFAPGLWSLFEIEDTGASDTGTSTPFPVPSIPPAGFTTWSDGRPYTIKRDPGTGAPEIRWSGSLGGTEIRGGQVSAIVWFETNATAWTESIVTLLDGGVGGSAVILSPAPEPSALALLGLGSVLFVRRRRMD